MNAFSFWKGRSFTLLEYLSLLSTSINTSFPKITLYYDPSDCPDNEWWSLLDTIPRLEKEPADEMLQVYLDAFVPTSARPITDVRILADIFRYGHLYRHGGAWLDLDTLQVRDLNAMMLTRPFCAGWESPEFVNIAVLAFPVAHPILENILGKLALRLSDPAPAFNALGPGLMTTVIHQMGLEDMILPRDYFYPIHYRQAEETLFGLWPLPEQTYSIHAWAYLTRHHFEKQPAKALLARKSTFFQQANLLLERFDRQQQKLVERHCHSD